MVQSRYLLTNQPCGTEHGGQKGGKYINWRSHKSTSANALHCTALHCTARPGLPGLFINRDGSVIRSIPSIVVFDKAAWIAHPRA